MYKPKVKYTDCVGICGFCEIRDTCDNPKRLKYKIKKLPVDKDTHKLMNHNSNKC